MKSFRSFLKSMKQWKRVERLLTCAQQENTDTPVVAMVPEHRWVKVMNLTGAHNGNGFHSFGDGASIKYGGELLVVAYDLDEVLVRHKAPTPGFGACADTGTLCFIPCAEFSTMTTRYEEITANIAAEQELVHVLLEWPVPDPSNKPVTEHRWVQAMNLRGVMNANEDFEFGMTGSIDRPGILREIGRRNGRVLVEYVTGEHTAGAQLPTGSLLFVDEAEFTN